MYCTEFIVKNVLFFFNLVFTLAGAALIGVGIAVIYQSNTIEILVPLNLSILAIPIIVTGMIIYVIAFFGCCGAIKESRCLLITYAVCMVILVLQVIALTAIMFQNLSIAREEFETWVNSSFTDPSLTNAFHEMENLLSCCGTTDANSYLAAGRPVPGTCCGGQVNDICTSATYKGCIEALGDNVERYLEAIVAVLIIVIIVELVALVLSIYMNKTISKRRREVR